jgi:hypothetical protein
MGIAVLTVGSAAKRRATLRGGVASLHATTCRAFVTSVEPRHSLVARIVGSTGKEGA